MKNIITNQLMYEAQTWKRALVFMQTEVTFMKNRLVQILKELDNAPLLEEIEHYQHDFIELEKTLNLFRQDVSKQIELIEKNHEASLEKLYQKLNNQNKLRKEIGMAEKLFIQTELSFNLSFSDKLTKNQLN